MSKKKIGKIAHDEKKKGKKNENPHPEGRDRIHQRQKSG